MVDFKADGDVNADNLNLGTQNFHGAVYFGGSGRGIEKTPPPSNKIFLSYGRGDDDPDYHDITKSFTRKLYTDLTGAGFDVWWDAITDNCATCG